MATSRSCIFRTRCDKEPILQASFSDSAAAMQVKRMLTLDVMGDLSPPQCLEDGHGILPAERLPQKFHCTVSSDKSTSGLYSHPSLASPPNLLYKPIMAAILRHALPIRPAAAALAIAPSTKPAARTFSSTPTRAISLQLQRNPKKLVRDIVPAYPYGAAQWYKQSDLGLYGGSKIRFGNNVGKRIAVKTRRSWKPNVFNRRLWSLALNRYIQVRVTARALRTIDKVGGLDEYLLGDKPARIKELGLSGWWLRWAIMQTPKVQRRFERERRELGLSSTPTEGNPDWIETEASAPAKAAVRLMKLRRTVEENEINTGVIEAAEDAAIEEVLNEDQLSQGQIAQEEAEELAAAEDGKSDVVVETEAPHIDGKGASMDGEMELQFDPKIPPLVFRVGPGQHLKLTAQGWRRTRPNIPRYRLRQREAPDWIGPRLAAFKEALQKGFEQKHGKLEDPRAVDSLAEKRAMKSRQQKWEILSKPALQTYRRQLDKQFEDRLDRKIERREQVSQQTKLRHREKNQRKLLAKETAANVQDATMSSGQATM